MKYIQIYYFEIAQGLGQILALRQFGQLAGQGWQASSLPR